MAGKKPVFHGTTSDGKDIRLEIESPTSVKIEVDFNKDRVAEITMDLDSAGAGASIVRQCGQEQQVITNNGYSRIVIEHAMAAVSASTANKLRLEDSDQLLSDARTLTDAPLFQTKLSSKNSNICF